MRIAEEAHRLPLAAVAALGLMLAASGCGLDKVQTPPLIGPSETGYSVQLTALPDTLNADGVSAVRGPARPPRLDGQRRPRAVPSCSSSTGTGRSCPPPPRTSSVPSRAAS